MKGICNDPTQYLIGVKYIKMLSALAGGNSSVEVYIPLQMDVGGATERLS